MSTSHARLELVEEITSSLDNKKHSVAKCIAFGTIHHGIKVGKM